jgi:flagellar L-ring protein precursor FlgH
MDPRRFRLPAALLLALGLLLTPAARAKSRTETSSVQLRAAYIERLEQKNAAPVNTQSTGSLWKSGAALDDLSTDYKAHNLYDTVVIEVAVQTTAAQSGTVDSERAFNTTSGITGLVGGIATHGTNPLLNANSNTTLKGTGQTASDTTFATSLTGEVIAVLPNGDLVIEAERRIFMNNQHENVIIRGVARPGDISQGNTIPSSALSDLEIEMKGKGIIADSVRSPNFLTKAVLWLFGF